jgi:SAM-dependent methyltransferase
MQGFDHSATTRTWDALYYNDPLAIRFYDDAIRRVLVALRAGPGDRILDAGCGAGVHAIRAAGRGCLVDAIDLSRAALDDGESRAQGAGVGHRIRFFQEDLTRLTFSDGSYERIFSWGVLIHIPAIDRALDELARVLAVGGRLALYVSNSTALQLIPRRVRRWLAPGRDDTQRLPYGLATQVDLHEGKIWVWFNDVAAIVRHLDARGLTLVARETGEFSDRHLRCSGALRRVLLGANYLFFRLRLAPALAQNNLLVFEKRPPA